MDWENSGVSTAEAEIGRAVVTAASTGSMRTARKRVVDLFSGLALSPTRVAEPSLAWFGPWLEGHLMFLRYCALRVTDRDLAGRFRRDLRILVDFLSEVDPLLRSLQESWRQGLSSISPPET